MAVRVPVVVSQSSRRDGRSVDLEESLITQLMMTPGLDATIVASLDAIQLDSTDHLCLQDFGQEIFLAGWLPMETASLAWVRLQLDGQLQAFDASFQHRSPPETVPAPVRRIRYLQLTSQTSVDDVIEQLQRILASRRVHTVSIQPLGGPPKNSPATSVRPPLQPLTQPRGQPLTAPEIFCTPEGTKFDDSPAFSAAAVEAKPNNWDSLDKLVEDLDALDL